MIRLSSSLDRTRAPCHHRYTDTSFIYIPFDPPERSVALEKVRISSTLMMRAVIAGKNHDRILIQTQLFQFSHYIPHVFIQPGDHGGKGGQGLLRGVITAIHFIKLTNIRSLLEWVLVHLINRIMRKIQFRMRQRISKHRKEWLLLMIPDELQCLLMNQILWICLASIVLVFRKKNLLLIMP